MSAFTTHTFLDHYRKEILLRWAELWHYIQKNRPESHFPDPPFETIFNQLPYDPAGSVPLSEVVLAWFSDSPIFCSGAAFCQLHVSIAGLLINDQVPNRKQILSEIERSMESMILEAGTRRWVSTLLKDGSKQGAVQSERLAVIGQLAAGVAHEVGNPLTSISSIVQILQRKTDDPFFREQLTHIKKSIDRIAKIVHELVDFSRPAPSTPSHVQVDTVLLTAINLVKYDNRAKNISFDMEIEELLPGIEIVSDQLLQVFVNLLINAVDAIEGTGKITARVFTEGESILITIHDTGRGISPDIIGRIFDPFFSTKPIGKGTGLGLSVSYGIVKRYNGTITVESDRYKGTTFILKLPSQRRT